MISASALEAANRIEHMDYPDELSENERIAAIVEDAELVSAELMSIWATERGPSN